MNMINTTQLSLLPMATSFTSSGGFCTAVSPATFLEANTSAASNVLTAASDPVCALFRPADSRSFDDLMAASPQDPRLQIAEDIPTFESTEDQMAIVLQVKSWAESELGRKMKVSDVVKALDRCRCDGNLERYTNLPQAARTLDLLSACWDRFREKFENLAKQENPLEQLTDEEKEKSGAMIRWGLFLVRQERPSPERCKEVDHGLLEHVSPRVAGEEDALRQRILQKFPQIDKVKSTYELAVLSVLAHRTIRPEMKFAAFARIVSGLLPADSPQIHTYISSFVKGIIERWVEFRPHAEKLAVLPEGKGLSNHCERLSYVKQHMTSLIGSDHKPTLTTYHRLCVFLWHQRAVFETPEIQEKDIPTQPVPTEMERKLIDAVQKRYPQLTSTETPFIGQMVIAAHISLTLEEAKSFSTLGVCKILSGSFQNLRLPSLQSHIYLAQKIITRWDQIAPLAKRLAALQSPSEQSDSCALEIASLVRGNDLSHLKTASKEAYLNSQRSMVLYAWENRQALGLPEPQEGIPLEAASPTPAAAPVPNPKSQEEQFEELIRTLMPQQDDSIQRLCVKIMTRIKKNDNRLPILTALYGILADGNSTMVADRINQLAKNNQIL